MNPVKMAYVAVWVLAVLGCAGCGLFSSESEQARLPVPKFVSKTADTAFVEHGIDAIPEADGIFLEWFSPPGEAVSGTKIFRRPEGQKKFAFLAKVELPETTFVDFDVAIQRSYSYYLMFYGKSNSGESAHSDTVHYFLFPKPENLHAAAGGRPLFSWTYAETPPLEYLLRLESGGGARLIWQAGVVSYDPVIQVFYNFDGSARLDSLKPEQSYRWRVDVVGPDLYSGAESKWSWIKSK